jgi:hypothetical protein
MSDKMRWRYGETNPVIAAVDSASVIDIGDLVYLNVDDALPASSQTDQGSETLNQQKFADNFLGVAMQRSASGDTDPIRVATSGVFEMDCASATFEIGDPVGASEATSGTALLDQTVERVDLLAEAIGRVAVRQTTAKTNVWISIFSSVMGVGADGASSWSGSGA